MVYARLLLRLVVDVGVSTLEGLVGEEVRNWLDRLPRLILYVASRRLTQPEREAIYRNQWLPRLTRMGAALLKGLLNWSFA